MPLNMPSCFHHINHQPNRPKRSYVLNPTMMNLHETTVETSMTLLGISAMVSFPVTKLDDLGGNSHREFIDGLFCVVRK